MAADGNLDANDTAARHANSGHHARRSDFVRRAKAAVGDLPSRLDQGIKNNPYTVLVATCAVGMGVGVVLSSRIVRAILTSAATVVAVELTRALLRETLPRGRAPSVN